MSTSDTDEDEWLGGLRAAGLPVRDASPSERLPAASPAVERLVEDSWRTPTELVRAGDLALRSWAPATVEAYGEDWRWFAAWCHVTVGLDDPLEANDQVVAEYVAAMVRDRLAFATIRRRLAGIAFAFDVTARRPSPTRSELVRRVVKGAARTVGTAQRRAAPLSLDEVRQLVDGLTIARPNSDKTVIQRDKLLLALGWAAALRSSELVALDVEDLSYTGDPDRREGGMLVRIRHAKGDQRARSEYVAVPYGAQAVSCPVRLALVTTRRRSGALFVHVDRHGKPRHRLRNDAVSRIVKAAVADVLQLDPAPYSGQSLRAGFVTEARRNGVPDHLIARHTRHKSLRLLDVYDRPSQLLTEPALGEWW